MKNNIYPIVSSYFSKEITIILNKYKKILEGNGWQWVPVKKIEEKFKVFKL